VSKTQGLDIFQLLSPAEKIEDTEVSDLPQESASDPNLPRKQEFWAW